MEKVDWETVQIETDDFGGDTSIVAMLVDERWFSIKDKLNYENESEVQVGLFRNRFKHVHQLWGTIPFYNCTVFKTVTPVLTAIDLRPDTATIAKGQGRAFVVEPTGTGNPSAKCTFEHDGTSDNTYITPTGFLFIGIDETTTPITVTATSTVDPLITDTATVTVV